MATFGTTTEPANGSTITEVPSVLRMSVEGYTGTWPEDVDTTLSYYIVNGVNYAEPPSSINTWTSPDRVGKITSSNPLLWPVELREGTQVNGSYTWKMMVYYGGGYHETPTRTFTLADPDYPPPPPAQPSTPSPANAATEVDFSTFEFSWVDEGGADTFDVYLGPTSGDLTLVSSAQEGTTYTTTKSALVSLFGEWPTTDEIYWRVDATNEAGTTEGAEWHFATAAKINAVTMSADGTIVLCMTTRGLRSTSDMGGSWTTTLPDGIETSSWSFGGCSGDGTYLIVKKASNNALYRSGDSGANWGTIDPADGETFSANAIAMSESGQYVVITGANSSTTINSCYISTDYGVTWECVHPRTVAVTWTTCDISDDGQVIGVGRTGSLYVSFDGGASWAATTPPASYNWWTGFRISGDGKVGIVANTGATNEVFKNKGWFNQITIDETSLTAYARSLIAADNSAEAATTLGLGTTDSPTFTGLTLSGLTASRLMATNGSKGLASVSDLTAWVAGTANEIAVASDGDGTITIGLVDPLIVGKGGTGVATLTTAYGLLAAGTAATGAVQTLAAGLTTQILVGGGAEALPAWGTDIPTAVTIGAKYIYRADGTDVPVADGGTGASTLTDHGILLGSGTDAITPLGAATDGQLPIGSTGADPVLATLTGTENQIAVTNGAGTITLSLTGNMDEIAALTPTDSNIIVGNGTTWVAESGDTARTSLGLGTGDSPTFTSLILTTTSGNPLYAGPWSGAPLTIEAHTNIYQSLYCGNDGESVGRLRVGSNYSGGFIQWNRYYSGSGNEQMDTTRPSWAVLLSGSSDSFVLQRSPAGSTTLATVLAIRSTDRCLNHSGGGIFSNTLVAPDVLPINTLGSQSLTNPGLTSGTSWTATGDCTLTKNRAQFLYSSGAGSTLTQTSGTMAVAGVASRWYSFTYTATSMLLLPTLAITTSFAESDVPLPTEAGTHTVYFRAAASPGDFVISATLTVGQRVYLDTFSLKEVAGTFEAGGSIRTNDKFNVAGTDGISDSSSGVPTSLTLSGGIVTAITRGGTAKFGDGGTTDYSEFEADGTLVFKGAATVWNDANIGAMALALPVASQPDEVNFLDSTGTDTGITTWGFAVGEKVSGAIDIPHDYKVGSNFTPHVHFQIIAAPAGGTDKAKWQITYGKGRAGSVLAAATTITKEVDVTTRYSFYRADFTAVTGTDWSFGDQFIFTLSRVAASADEFAGDLLIATVGLHYECDTAGSRTMTTK